jgi:hypothetical protein
VGQHLSVTVLTVALVVAEQHLEVVGLVDQEILHQPHHLKETTEETH